MGVAFSMDAVTTPTKSAMAKSRSFTAAAHHVQFQDAPTSMDVSSEDADASMGRAGAASPQPSAGPSGAELPPSPMPAPVPVRASISMPTVRFEPLTHSFHNVSHRWSPNPQGGTEPEEWAVQEKSNWLLNNPPDGMWLDSDLVLPPAPEDSMETDSSGNFPPVLSSSSEPNVDALPAPVASALPEPTAIKLLDALDGVPKRRLGQRRMSMP
eukprot:TRINITY_DN1358_c0_g1_i1.p3 TRINITY_DN1358_c0_g1~~TRINITY_DN1358_c0_g1_i1.p3  ORF type:complete len:212 (-),score=67.43 TRINITY_DN1358_c0_g1_i1:446-1081(-)